MSLPCYYPRASHVATISGLLADAGLVRDTRRGRERLWELHPNELAQARQALDEISRRWDEALDRLKRYVE